MSASLAMHLGAAGYYGWSHRSEPLDAAPQPVRVTLVMQPASGTQGEQALFQAVEPAAEQPPQSVLMAGPPPSLDPASQAIPDREAAPGHESGEAPPPEPEQAPDPHVMPAPAPVEPATKPAPREASPPKTVSPRPAAPSAAGSARAEKPAAPVATRPGMFSAPSLAGISNPKPRYPRQARRRGLEGLVILSVEVGLDGRVAGLAVERSSGFAVLDNAARRAVADWRFRPALRGGEPVSAQLEVPVRFRLRDS
ncbi:MAG: energy transducer TonB [Pseudomonadota bacterium]